VETKVVKIISDTTVVLGAGSRQGVKEGMEFVIYEEGEPIFDPESSQSLGTLEIAKGRVEVSHVQENMSTARTFKHRIKRTKGATALQALLPPFFETEEVEVHDKLKVERVDDSYYQRLKVKVGDKARQIQE
jgi:hypothetical protein